VPAAGCRLGAAPEAAKWRHQTSSAAPALHLTHSLGHIHDTIIPVDGQQRLELLLLLLHPKLPRSAGGSAGSAEGSAGCASIHSGRIRYGQADGASTRWRRHTGSGRGVKDVAKYLHIDACLSSSTGVSPRSQPSRAGPNGVNCQPCDNRAPGELSPHLLELLKLEGQPSLAAGGRGCCSRVPAAGGRVWRGWPGCCALIV
jgi:hypothetical protein